MSSTVPDVRQLKDKARGSVLVARTIIQNLEKAFIVGTADKELLFQKAIL